jgi:putative phage-type endonuclease
MIFHDIQQNTEEWEALRLGKFTASTFADLFATKSTAKYRNAIRKVVFERLTGESPESFKSDWMDRGHELEPFAREAYENYSFDTIQNGGFFEMNEWTGASPDGLIGEDGQIEIKCPAYSTFIDYLINQKLPSEYLYQVQGQLFVTGRKWCDFVAYHPKLPLVVVRVLPDPEVIASIEVALLNAIRESEVMIECINQLNKVA